MIGFEPKLPLKFTGLVIKRETDGKLSVSQENFAQNLVQMEFDAVNHELLTARA